MKFTKRLVSIGLSLCLACLAVACESKDAPAVMTQEEKELLDKLKAKEREKSELIANPMAYLEFGAWEKFDKGFLNSYTKITSVEIENKSQFYVDQLSGYATIYTQDNVELGMIPISVTAELKPRQKVKVKLNSGELSGNGTRAKFQVQSLTVRE